MALPGTLLQIWQRLIEPSASVRAPTAHFQARATSSILVLILALGVIQLGLRLNRPPFPPPLIAILFITAASYPLSRTRYYRLAGMITIAALWLLPLLTIISAPVITLSFIFMILRLIVLSVLTTYILFSLPISILFGLIIFISFLIIPPTTVMRAPAMHLAVDFGVNGLGVFAVFLIARQFDLNARRISEQARLASEERYRVIVEAQSEMISRWLPDTTLTFVNDAYCRYIGQSREELIGTPFAKFLLPEDREAARQILATLTPENPIVTSEHRSFDSEKGVRWQQWTDMAIFDPAGRIIEYQSVGRDITELKRAEEAEREQRRFAEALSSTAALISSTLNLDEVLDRILNQIVLVNAAISAEILLIEGDNAQVVRTRSDDPQYMRDILKLRLPLQDARNLREMIESGHTLMIPNVLDYAGWIDTDASRWIRALVGAPIRLEGETIGFLVMSSNQEAFFTETDAARLQSFADQAAIAIRNARLYHEVSRYASDLEALVKKRTAELDLTEQRLRAILDGTGEGIIYTEREIVQYANFEFSRMTGYALDELVGQPYNHLYVSTPNHDPLAEARRGVRINSIWRGEVQIRCKDGSIFAAGLTAALLNSGEAERFRAVTVVRDISQEKLLQLQRSNLVTYASHELRTPITNLKTRLYLLRRRPESLAEHLNILDMVTERMRQLVEDLLDISRLEHGLIPLRRDTLALQDVIDEVVRVQSAEATQKGLELQVAQPLQPIYVLADRHRLIQVVTNLLTNALNYTPAGGLVRLKLEQTEESAVIQIEDSGIGIAPENLPYIFQPFFRVVSEVTGTGLGLSIAKEIIEMHGGSISVRSQLEHGSTFQITLPLLTSAEID